LLVFRGRIRLYDLADQVRAAEDFDKAKRLAPKDPLPLIALGEEVGCGREARRRGQFQLALALSVEAERTPLGSAPKTRKVGCRGAGLRPRGPAGA
jgi:hypothetical protein